MRGVGVVLAGVAVLVVAGCARAPYSTDTRATSSMVNFASFAASPLPIVRYGVAGGGCADHAVTASPPTPISVAGRSEFQFKATLTGLSTGTTYCYRVFQGSNDLLGNYPSATFHTAPAPGDPTPFSFAVVGDWGAGTPDEGRVLGQIAASPAQFVVTVGDNVYERGSESDFGDVVGGNVFPLSYWPVVGTSRPVFAAIGNHDMELSSSGGLPFLQNFPQDATVAASVGRFRQDPYCCTPTHPDAENLASAWYAFDWGAARFYILQAAWKGVPLETQYESDFTAHWKGPVAGCAPCGAQLAWLKADLAAHASTNLKFAFFHYPLHSDASPESDRFLNGPRALEGVLADNGVKIAFNGHSHIYERNLPQISGRPMVSYVTGAGGAELGVVMRCSGFDAYAIGDGTSCRAPVPTSSVQVFHYLLVRVNGTQVTVTPTDETGRTFDTKTYSFP